MPRRRLTGRDSYAAASSIAMVALGGRPAPPCSFGMKRASGSEARISRKTKGGIPRCSPLPSMSKREWKSIASVSRKPLRNAGKSPAAADGLRISIDGIRG